MTTNELRRCLHLTMRHYINGKLDESKPCLHWECVERNKAADRIEELEANQCCGCEHNHHRECV